MMVGALVLAVTPLSAAGSVQRPTEHTVAYVLPGPHHHDEHRHDHSIASIRIAAQATAEVMAAGAILCEGDGQTGNRVQVMYLHPPGVDRYATLLPRLRSFALGVDGMFNASAQETGGNRHVRYVTDAGCQVSVLNVQLSAAALATWSAMVTALQSSGYNRTDRKYLMFTESTVYCGLGSLYADSSPGQSNPNNRGPSYARVDKGCWDGNNQLAIDAAAHELGHNLGAVQNDAPHPTGGFHCTDEYDRMCGDDGSGRPPVIRCSDPAREHRFDCNHDDYFSTNPPAGSYLATHWNIANSSFLIRGGPSTPVSGNWDGSGGAGVGVAATYGGPDWDVLLRNNLSTGTPSVSPYRYGGSACRVVTGDWNADRITSMGAVCRNGIEWQWSLRDPHSGGTPSYTAFKYGNNACVPVTGDWNGDGTTTIGVVCKNGIEWQWSLRDANGSGPVSYQPFNYGNNACTPITGDWNGDGRTTIGVACKDGGEWLWHLRDSNNAGWPSYTSFKYGSITCAPVTGDWNGDRTTTVGVACKGPLLWDWWLRDALSSGPPSYPSFKFGTSS